MVKRNFTIAGIIMLVVLISFVFLGCTRREAASASPDGKRTVRIMVWGSTEGRYNYQRLFDQMFPDFVERIQIEWLLGGTGDDTVAERVRLALAANESITDVVQLNYTQVPEFASLGALHSLDSIVAPVRNEMVTAFRLMTEFEGQTVAIANSFKAKIWFYRKDIFDRAGINVEEVRTLDDFINAGRRIQQIDPKYMMWTLGPANPPYQYMMVLSGTDTVFADRNGNWQLTTDPNFRRLLEAFRRLVESGVVANIPEWTPDWERAFADEILISYPNATWLASDLFLHRYAPEQRGLWHATQWPSFIGEEGGSEAGGDVFVIPIIAREVEAAKEVLHMLSLDPEGWFLGMALGRAPVPVLQSWANDPRTREPHNFIGGDYAAEVLRSLNNFRLFGWDPAAALTLSIINPYFDAAINGLMSIDDALRTAQAALESQVGNPWQMW